MTEQRMATVEAAARGKSRRDYVLAILIVGLLLLAAALRFETIVQRPLWHDERLSLRLGQRVTSPADLFHIAKGRRSEHPALHPIVVAAFLAVEDDWTLATRLPSALGGVASVGLLAWLGSVLWDRKVGMTAGLLLALSIYHVNYSQDARAYSLLLAALLGQYLSLIYFLRNSSYVYLFPFVLLALATLYLHHIALVAQVALAITAAGLLLFEYRKERAIPPASRRVTRQAVGLAMAYGLIALGYLPQLLLVLEFWRAGTDRGPGWKLLAVSFQFLHELFVRWGNGRAIAPYYEVTLLVGVWYSMNRRAALVVFPWLVSPFLFFALVPFHHFFDIRYLMAALPACLLLVACGISQLSRLASGGLSRLPEPLKISQWAGPIGLMLVLAPGLIAAGNNYADFRLTTVRCEGTKKASRVLESGSFCRESLILNSIFAHGSFIIRSADPDGVGPALRKRPRNPLLTRPPRRED